MLQHELVRPNSLQGFKNEPQGFHGQCLYGCPRQLQVELTPLQAENFCIFGSRLSSKPQQLLKALKR
jgi:hypothetical protein